jgi:2-hydroxychromene-2-carboxylate isomerase
LRLLNQNIKDELKKRTQEAFSKGIFGAPTFYVNNKVFWGQDRLEYALAESLK